jgi:hypothetical protein
VKKGDLVIYRSPVTGETDSVLGVILDISSTYARVYWTDIQIVDKVRIEWLQVVSKGEIDGSR